MIPPKFSINKEAINPTKIVKPINLLWIRILVAIINPIKVEINANILKISIEITIDFSGSILIRNN